MNGGCTHGFDNEKGERAIVSVSARGNHTAEISLYREDEKIFEHDITRLEAHALTDCVRMVDGLRPIDMILHCPACGTQHIDAPEHWGGEVKVHRSHLCVPAAGGCGHIWRPADVPTNGVQAIATRGKDDTPALPQRSAGDIHQIIEHAIQGLAGRSLTSYDYEEVFACCQAAILAARR